MLNSSLEPTITAKPRSLTDAMISIVAPVYNESANIDAFLATLLPILRGCGCAFEVLCVDDGSSDDSAQRIRTQMAAEPCIKLLSLTRNFGKERALAAGIDHAKGDAVIPIDADLQDPPELIPDMLDKWLEGYDMVVAIRSTRTGDSNLKRQSARGFYKVMNRLSEVHVPPNAGDFRLIDRRVVDTLKGLPERTRFHKGLYAWLGYDTCQLYFDRPDRHEGRSSWNYWRLWNYALDGIFSFSTAPLRLWSYVGGTTALLGFLYAIYTMLRTLIYGTDLPGYASLLVLILVLNGLCMIGVGIIGEYIGRIFAEVKQRPTYLVDHLEQGGTHQAEDGKTE